MEISVILVVCSTLLTLGQAADPVVNCPVPISPQNGYVQSSVQGTTLVYACDPGYKLKGAKYAHCDGTQWKPEPPTCEPRPENANMPPLLPRNEEEVKSTTPRPLFKWDDGDNTKEEAIIEVNDTEADMQGDEARFHMVLYPHQRVITRVQRVRSGSELEEEEQKQQANDTSTAGATPSIIYVRRPQYTGKSIDKENALLHQYRRAALHYARTGPHGDVQIFQLPEDAQSDEVLRHLYWSGHYLDPRYASMLAHTTAGHPLVMTLSESQIAWINSLHPEVRDKYLKDLYGIRPQDEEGVRAQAFLRRYEDVANYLYANPYYYRQRLSVLRDDPVASFDYSCYQTEDDGYVTRVRAPGLPNAYVHRYDRRKNPNHPYNDYLAAEYRCRNGYALVDYRVNELYCSQRGWVGTLPACVPRN